MTYITTEDAAMKWNISKRRVVVLCSQNRIEGVIRKGKIFLIPSDTLKPVDARKKENKKEKLYNEIKW